MLFAEPMGQGWLQIEELALAFLLSAVIGLEREFRQKSAGLRTYTLVGLASALIMLVSKYGFTNILENYRIVLDPSRIAAQIVSGIGFIGGGVIFVRKDIVRGLTTASTVWLVAAVGMACGGGLPILAIFVAFGHFIVVAVFPILERKLPRSRWAPTRLQVSYQDGKGVLRDILVVCTQQEFSVSRTVIHRDPQHQDGQRLGKQSGKEGSHMDRNDGEREEAFQPKSEGSNGSDRTVSVLFEIRGAKSATKLAARLSEIDGVLSVSTDEYASHTPSD